MSKNLNETLKKVVVIFLIITLTYANLILIGENMVKGLISYAAEDDEGQAALKTSQILLMNKVIEINGEQKRVIQFAVETGVNEKDYPVKETTIQLHTDIINETLEDVKITKINQNSYTSGTWTISEDKKIVISLLNENETFETKAEGTDMLLVTYLFPNTEITEIMNPLENVKLTTYSETEILEQHFEESYINDIDNMDNNELLSLDIINNDIHKTTISDDGQVEYTETLNLDLSYRKDASNIIIEDEQNIFYNNDGQKNSEVVLKYKTTTINKEDLLSLLGEEGKLVITDTVTNKVLVEITKEIIEAQEVNVKVEQKFTDEETSEEDVRSNVTVTDETVEIEYAVDVTNFKCELTNIKPQSESEIEFSNFVISNTKTISNINDVDSLKYLQENVKYTIDETSKTVNSKITFKDTITRANLTVDNTEWVVGQANTVKYTITLDTSSEKSEMFINPMFLIELPSSVETVNTANSEFVVNNNNGAFLGKRVFVTTVLERKFVVITLTGEQTSETIANGNTTIDLTLELNVAENSGEVNETTKLYYQNNTVTAYESGKGFDTAEVTVSMIMESEPKDDIPETDIPGDKEENKTFVLGLVSSTNEIIKPGEEFRYDTYVYNNNTEEKQNLQLTCTLPEGISIVKVVDDEENEVEYTFDEVSRKFIIKIDKITGVIPQTTVNEETGETIDFISPGRKVFKITVKADNLQEGIYSKEIKCTMELLEEGNILGESQEVVNTISDTFLSIEIDELPETLNELEEFVLGVKVANKGLISDTGVDININTLEEISLSKYKTTILAEDGQEEVANEGTTSGNFEMKNLSIVSKNTYYFQITAEVNKIDETKQVTITGTVDGKEFSWTVELVNVTDEPEDPSNPSDPTKPSDPTNPSDPSDPSNPSNPSNPSDPSDPSDPSNPTNPNNPTNPDNSEIEEDIFDLSLNQYLNKITVTNAKGTTTYEYKDTNFAKVEIHSKYMNGSKVTLEYKIVIKNEGTIPGYARKIVNYSPKDLTFNPELNKDWYLGDDGNIYSIALIDKLLNPGETAEINIVLEKQMTNENTGTVTNIVEIYEASNDEDIEDVNSIPGDKLDGQNDMSKVEVLISTSTGTIILYTTLAIAVIAILGFGFYKIKKVALNKKGGC